MKKLFYLFALLLLNACTIDDFSKPIKDLMAKDEVTAVNCAKEYVKENVGDGCTVTDDAQCLFEKVPGDGSESWECYSRKWMIPMKTADGKTFKVAVDCSYNDPACGDDIHFEEWRKETEDFFRNTFKFQTLQKIIIQRGSCKYFMGEHNSCLYATIYLIGEKGNLKEKYGKLLEQYLNEEKKFGDYFDVKIYNFKNKKSYEERKSFFVTDHDIYDTEETNGDKLDGYFHFYSSSQSGFNSHIIARTGGTQKLTLDEAKKLTKNNGRDEKTYKVFLKYDGLQKDDSKIDIHFGDDDSGQVLSIHSDGDDNVGYILLQDKKGMRSAYFARLQNEVAENAKRYFEKDAITITKRRGGKKDSFNSAGAMSYFRKIK